MQEHIGEVTKFHNKFILLPNRAAMSMPPSDLRSLFRFINALLYSVLVMQSISLTSYEDPHPSQITQGVCVPIDAAPPHSLSITSLHQMFCHGFFA